MPRQISALSMDISEYLLKIYEPTRAAPQLTVAYHAACSLQHGQKITAAPKTLLRKAGFTVVEPKDPHLCCGSAGTYNILQPEIAATLRRRKLDTLKAKAPDVIAAGNIGCLTQLCRRRRPHRAYGRVAELDGRGGEAGGLGIEEESSRFLKKAAQKLLLCWAMGVVGDNAHGPA